MSTLAEIEAAIPKLNVQELADLERLVQAERRKAERGFGSSILNITPASVGRILKPFSPDDDLLGEMLEGR
jgi:hypothetical protein